MSREIDIENTSKAAQCADLLIQDLQELHRSCDPIVSLLILPEIEKVVGIKQRMEAIVNSLQMAQ
jgi:hypothetical protein